MFSETHIGSGPPANFLAGCGEKQPKTDNLTQPTDTSQFKGMLGDQMKNVNLKEKAPKK
jgi:hypothetical protein